MDNSAKGRYDMILGRYIWTELGLNLILSYHLVETDGVPLKGLTAPMVDLGMYEFKKLDTRNIKPE